jgi:hypothetical protein
MSAVGLMKCFLGLVGLMKWPMIKCFLFINECYGIFSSYMACDSIQSVQSVVYQRLLRSVDYSQSS